MLSNPIPGLKCPFYPQEEAVKRKLAIWDAPRRGVSGAEREAPLPWHWFRMLTLPPLMPSSFWIRDNQSTAIHYTPKFTCLTYRSKDVLLSFPFKAGLMGGRCAGSRPTLAVSHFRVCFCCKDPPHRGHTLPQSPHGHDSDRQNSLQHSCQGGQGLFGPASQLSCFPCPTLFPVPSLHSCWTWWTYRV